MFLVGIVIVVAIGFATVRVGQSGSSLAVEMVVRISGGVGIGH